MGEFACTTRMRTQSQERRGHTAAVGTAGIKNIMAYSWPSHCKRYLESMELEKRFLRLRVRTQRIPCRHPSLCDTGDRGMCRTLLQMSCCSRVPGLGFS